MTFIAETKSVHDTSLFIPYYLLYIYIVPPYLLDCKQIMSLFADAFRQLTSLQKDSETWDTGPLILVVATSLTDDTPITIDFSTKTKLM